MFSYAFINDEDAGKDMKSAEKGIVFMDELCYVLHIEF